VTDDNSRVGWARLPAELVDYCEAPRHAQLFVPRAAWRLALAHPDGSGEAYSLCTGCVEQIAATLGITVEQGALR
jgi:hypothetical protein